MRLKKQVLIIDHDEEVRDAIAYCFENHSDYLVFGFDSVNDAISFIVKNGKPFLVISELKMANGNGIELFYYLKEHCNNTKFALCSLTPATKVLEFENEDVYSITKPMIVKSCNQMIETFSDADDVCDYLPINLNLVLKYQMSISDLFLKLAENNFVKIYNSHDEFNMSVFEKYKSKDLKRLYFPIAFKEQVNTLIEDRVINHFNTLNKKDESYEVEVLDSLLDGIGQIGFSPLIIEACQDAICENLKTVQELQDLKKYLKILTTKPYSYIAIHTQIVTVVATTLVSKMQWRTPAIINKIVTAAFLHDLFIAQTSSMEDFEKNELMHDSTHVEEMSNIVKKIKNLPPDIDRIIFDHHEKPDGSGYPRKLKAADFSPITALFNFSHEISHLIYDAKDNFEKLQTKQIIIHLKNSGYDRPVFKKLFEALESISFY